MNVGRKSSETTNCSLLIWMVIYKKYSVFSSYISLSYTITNSYYTLVNFQTPYKKTSHLSFLAQRWLRKNPDLNYNASTVVIQIEGMTKLELEATYFVIVW